MEQRLDVIISERPGLYSIENFDHLKSTLAEYTKQYAGAQFDCENKESRLMAKSICADLRKMKTVIEDKRKEIKKSCLEPYNVLEKKCKELTGMIDRTTDGIDRQLKTYEAEREAKKRCRIQEIFDQAAGDLRSYITLDEIFDGKWLNATTSESSIKDAIALTVSGFRDQYDTIMAMPEDVRQAVLPVWKATKDMTQVTRRVTEFNEQKARILEAERERREAAEREKLVEQVRQEARAEKEADPVPSQDDGYMDIPDFGDVPPNNLKTVLFRVTGSPDELDELRCLIDSLGLPYEEQEV